MKPAPPFFLPLSALPGIETDDQELVYRECAERWARGGIPARRIYSITYTHDGEEWIATVGETLRGVRHRVTRSKGQSMERTQQLSDGAVVLAIFPGYPYIVVTNYRFVPGVRSAWENPFMAGQPNSITYFTLEENGKSRSQSDNVN